MITNPNSNANAPVELAQPENTIPSSRQTEPANNLPRLAYSLREAAQMLGVSEKTIRRLVDRGLLKRSGGIRHLRFTRQALEKYLEHTTL